STSWTHPITLNVYSDSFDANVVPTTLLATVTQNVTIPWRPAADPTCSGGTAWRAGDGNCYNGLAFNATFDLSSLNATLTNSIVVGVAFNTQSYGAAPIGSAGPYNSLNVGVPTSQTASVGTDSNSNGVFWNTSFAAFYADGGAGGVGTFREDTNWAPNGTVALQIEATQVCTPTGFSRDGMDLTAAQIGGTVSSELDATGCNIGLYVDGDNPGGVASGADIHGANYFGVVVNGTSANVQDGSIHNIGEVPFNGTQHGNAVFYTAGASGTVDGNTVSLYQKGGIIVDGTDTAVTVTNNAVTGLGQVDFIAQNGIQISRGATALVKGNTVSGNWYTPKSFVSCGLLFFQAGGVKQQANNLFDNEINLCNVGRGGGNYNPGS
ncbi:MAG TPA: right-handed parallel beta-helix repeat-containing protein, partial [Candidatus Saccharimonadales bacterium]